MRVLSVHNYYQQPGGEDEVFAAEARLLRERGHQVREYTRSNVELVGRAPWRAGPAAVWNRESYKDLRKAIRRERFAVCHFHNFFPLVSPAAHRAARDERVPVVQTLHNYRLLCPAANFYRSGAVCESCLGKRVPWEGVSRACYRGSRLATASVAAMIGAHHWLGTWREVDCYVALTEFARRKFVEGGLPADRIVVKPNFVHPDPGAGDGAGAFALFVGRLAPEKDVGTLIRAAARLGNRLKVKIVGDGPDRDALTKLAAGLDNIEFLGSQPKQRVVGLMKQAALLVVPSAWFEGFPMVIAEAFAVGLPVVASRLGALEEIVDDSRTGLLFGVGDAEDLADKLDRIASSPGRLPAMRREARAEFETKYGADVNYWTLERIYQLAIDRNGGFAMTPARACRTDMQSASNHAALCPHREILGTRVDATSYDGAVRQVLHWTQSRQSRYVCVATVNNVMEAYDSPGFLRVMNSADLVTPDGMPLVWGLRMLGVPGASRVYGPDLTPQLLGAAEREQVPVGFYGGSPAALKRLLGRVSECYPRLKVPYAWSPPFRPLGLEEDLRIADEINRSGARLVFVGLSSPKQDRWMARQRGRIRAVMIGVGAAFDFLAGTKPQAPRWMMNAGLEWLFRLVKEPRRLWKRYLKHNPRFVALFTLQLLGLWRSESAGRSPTQ